MVAVDVLLEVVAGDNTVDIEQEPNRIINGGAAGQQLQMIPVKLAMDLVDVTINCCCKDPKILKVLLQGKVCMVATELMVASLMMILYKREASSIPSKVYLLR
jgi:hypothetical protein